MFNMFNVAGGWIELRGVEWIGFGAAMLFLAWCAWDNRRTGFRRARKGQTAFAELLSGLVQWRETLADTLADTDDAGRPEGVVTGILQPAGPGLSQQLLCLDLLSLDRSLRPSAVPLSIPDQVATARK